MFTPVRVRAAVAVVVAVLAAALLAPVPTAANAAATENATRVSAPSASLAPARGDNPVRTKITKFRKNWVFRSKRLNRCAFISATAKLIGRWRWAYRFPDGSWNHDHKNWLGFKLKSPAIHVTGWPILGAGCNSTERARIKARISQGWYQSSCSLGVDVAVGFPWSVEFNPLYKCRTDRLGHTTTTEGPSRQTLHQWNTGTPLSFEGQLTPTKMGTAFSGKVDVRVHTRSSSDRVSYPMNIYIK